MADLIVASQVQTFNADSTVSARTKPNHNSSIQSVLSSGDQDVFVQMELFFAGAASTAATSAVEVMKRAKASRAVNDAKKAFQASCVPDSENKFRFSEAAGSFIVNWFAEYCEKGPDGKFTVMKPNTGVTYDNPSTVIANMNEYLRLIQLPQTDNNKGLLTAQQKGDLENIMNPTFKLDENGQEVLSDEIMTVMLQQANALYQNWLSGFQKISTSRVETLKELIRALS